VTCPLARSPVQGLAISPARTYVRRGAETPPPPPTSAQGPGAMVFPRDLVIPIYSMKFQSFHGLVRPLVRRSPSATWRVPLLLPSTGTDEARLFVSFFHSSFFSSVDIRDCESCWFVHFGFGFPCKARGGVSVCERPKPEAQKVILPCEAATDRVDRRARGRLGW